VSASVTVITASLPTRGQMLAECVASVAAQTVAPAAHLVGVDHARRGSSATRNGLVRAAESEWIAVLDDDDLMLSHHLETLLAASAEADIIYSYCAVEGRPGWNPSRPFDEAALRAGPNYIPITALIRRSLLVALGGWRDSSEVAAGWEDYDAWVRALDLGARFVCWPAATWVYRVHPGSKTYRGEMAAC
jgi:GT2 family glycosyltransferase